MLGRKATVPHKRAPNHQIDLGANFKRGGCVTKEAKVSPKKSLLGFFVAKRNKW
jgi:hypothetical protein